MRTSSSVTSSRITGDGIGVFGLGSNVNLVQGNIVQDTVGIRFNPSAGGSGVIISHFLDQLSGLGEVINGNNAIANTVRRNFGSGISNISNVDGQIIGNVVEENGSTYYGDDTTFGEAGNGIGVQSGPGVQAGPSGQPEANMLIRDNRVNGNGVHGIFLRTSGSQVENNEVFRNGYTGITVLWDAVSNSIIRNATGYNVTWDLADLNDTCDYNVWFGNTWGPVQPRAVEWGFTASYYPDCTAAGGTGPNPPPGG